MLSAAMTPALIVTIGYAADVDPGDWTGVVIVYPSLAVYAAGFLLSRRYPFYAVLAGGALLATPFVTLVGFGFEEWEQEVVGTVLAGMGAVLTAAGLAAEPRRDSPAVVSSPVFWTDIVGLSALAAGTGIALAAFDHEGVYAGFGVLSGLLIAGGLAMRRLTWTTVGLGALASYVIHLLAERRRHRQQLRADVGRLGHRRRRALLPRQGREAAAAVQPSG